MSMTSEVSRPKGITAFATWGLFWLVVAIVGAAAFFLNGIEELLSAWQRPEYSHGPLIPILSGLLFLRQLKEVPVIPGEARDPWPGVVVLGLALLVGLLGNLARINDIVAYALILWVGGILLVSFGWRQGRQFWPPVVHLVYMLPLPGVIYYKTTTYLQFISSELGVQFLQWLNVPVYLEGNIIDLGVYRLHVAEACSGLRYLFPILSFSYIFAVLYRGPMWHKAVLLVSAVPITIFMNSVRIAIAGYIVNVYGVEWVEGFTHFFEGWVIFMACVVILFGLAWMLLHLRRDKMSLIDALDLDTSGLGTQAARLRLVEPSKAMITGTLMIVGFALVWQLAPERDSSAIPRETFAQFPTRLDSWQATPPERLTADVERALGADDYMQVSLASPDWSEPVGLFMAWYQDQSQGGIHSPEVCLPGSGWEIAWLERNDIGPEIGSDRPFNLNRAVIQMGETRMLVYYWFQQGERRVAWDIAAKFYLLLDGITKGGQNDGAIVRLTTLIAANESDAAAEARLQDALKSVIDPLPRFVPES